MRSEVGEFMHRKTTSWLILLTLLTGLVSAPFATSAMAATDKGDAKATGGKRQKVIDFEDEVVEGLNKRPLDSLSQISEKDKRRRKMHLYRKRVGFRTETAESTKAARYTP